MTIRTILRTFQMQTAAYDDMYREGGVKGGECESRETHVIALGITRLSIGRPSQPSLMFQLLNICTFVQSFNNIRT